MVNIPTVYDDDWGMVYDCYTLELGYPLVPILSGFPTATFDYRRVKFSVPFKHREYMGI